MLLPPSGCMNGSVRRVRQVAVVGERRIRCRRAPPGVPGQIPRQSPQLAARPGGQRHTHAFLQLIKRQAAGSGMLAQLLRGAVAVLIRHPHLARHQRSLSLVHALYSVHDSRSAQKSDTPWLAQPNGLMSTFMPSGRSTDRAEILPASRTRAARTSALRCGITARSVGSTHIMIWEV